MAIADRKFGVEIECFGAPETAIINALSEVGIACWRDGRHAAVSDGWKLTTDGSVHTSDGGGSNCWEIVSPVLSGEAGLEQVQKVSRALIGAGIRVNSSCGLHVHVDTTNLSGADLANMAMRYAHFEQVIDTFMPSTRRGAYNTYCQPMTTVSSIIRRMQNIETLSINDLALSVRSRYYKLNLAAYLRHGTVEFRQHSGTVNGTKITNWIRFCVNFVETSKMNPENYTITTESISTPPPAPVMTAMEFHPNGDQIFNSNGHYISYSARKIVRALNNNRLNGDRLGVSVETLAQLVGVATQSIPAMISGIRQAYGIGTRALRKVRITEKYMLRGCLLRMSGEHEFMRTATVNPDPVPVETRQVRVPTFDYRNDNWSRGLDLEVVSFYQERTMEFASS